MGYSTARFHLHPSGWTTVVTVDKEDVPISFPLQEDTQGGAAVSSAAVAAWLARRGFATAGAAGRFTLNNLDMDSQVLQRGDTEVSLYAHKDALIELLLQFTLPRNAAPVSDWEAFTCELCAEWALAIFDAQASAKVEAGRFRHLLCQLPQWKLFAADPNRLSASLAGTAHAAS